jgi:hypothetical protein
MGYYMAGGSGPPIDRPGDDPNYETDNPYEAPVRRMNKWNGRALSRSMRRVKGFVKFARKAVHFTRTVKMKKRRRS